MTSFTLIEREKGQFYIEGELSFLSLNKKLVNSFKFLNSASVVTIDMSQVKTADSAGLALMVEWLKDSQLYKTQLLFDNVPRQLQVLAKLSGLDLTEYLLKSPLK